MRAIVVVFALAGCDRVFDLTGRGEDAATDGIAPRDDAPDDGGRGCPPIGEPPAFGGTPTLVTGMGCTDYHERDGMAVAECGGAIYTGALGDAFVATMITIESSFTTARFPRLLDATTMLVWETSNGTQGYWVEVHKLASGWGTPFRTAFGMSDPSLVIGFPSDGSSTSASAHVLRRTGDMASMQEWARESGQWNQKRAHTATEMGLTQIDNTSLDASGLRVLVSGLSLAMGKGTYYADRSTTGELFSTATKVTDAVVTPVMAQDCSGVWYSNDTGVYSSPRL